MCNSFFDLACPTVSSVPKEAKKQKSLIEDPCETLMLPKDFEKALSKPLPANDRTFFGSLNPMPIIGAPALFFYPFLFSVPTIRSRNRLVESEENDIFWSIDKNGGRASPVDFLGIS